MSNEERLLSIINKCKLKENEKEEFLSIINDIYYHDEFQIRMTDKFIHHGKVTLGEHILTDAVHSYKKAKKISDKNKEINIPICVKIAMMHDLYTLPYQKNPENKANSFFHNHGFRHPIEAVINANNWFPEMFCDKKESKMLIDGILHHMWPFPASSYSDLDKMELKNYHLYNNLTDDNKEIIDNSLKRAKLKSLSFSRPKYSEGKIVSKIDKKVSLKEFNTIKELKLILGMDKKNKRR